MNRARGTGLSLSFFANLTSGKNLVKITPSPADSQFAR